MINKLILFLFLMTILCSCHQKNNKNQTNNLNKESIIEGSKQKVLSSQKTCNLRFKVTTYIDEEEVDVALETFILKFKSEILLTISSNADTSNLIHDIPLDLKTHLLKCSTKKDSTKKYSFVVSCGSGCAMRYDEL
ncbi:MAG: hypothetical protein N4A37_11305 [Prolixibacteraceae bacterium]|jgi:hypothetical protein|nr:hypothetical protein [Prolixibacteraceae bacterium]